jgi:pyruvate/2-oxoacid:ferredoxin oxidoreductase alpha subunit
MHVSARTIATHALSIFGDHSDVMACRQTGFAMLCSGSVQEAQDMAAIASATTLAARVPFLHFFDGFRTSHEVSKIETLPDDTLRALVDDEAIAAHRARALSPDHPVLRGTRPTPTRSSRRERRAIRTTRAAPRSWRRPWRASRRSRAAATASWTTSDTPTPSA